MNNNETPKGDHNSAYKRLIQQGLSPAKRYLLVAGVILALLIPLEFIKDMVRERQHLYSKAVSSISASWGEAQTIIGPILVVPALVDIEESKQITQPDGKTIVERNVTTQHYNMLYLPQKLDIQSQLLPEERQRSIYKHTVYRSQISLDAVFNLPPVEKNIPRLNTMEWDKAYLSVGITDPRGIESLRSRLYKGDELPGLKLATWPKERAKDAEETTLSGISLISEPDPLLPLLRSGFHINLPLKPSPHKEETFAVQLLMQLNGSGGMRFAPLGETSRLHMQSSWPHPSFQGAKLPVEHSISAAGFTAQWQIPHLARSYSQYTLMPQSNGGSTGRHEMLTFLIGANLYEPLTYYTLIERATKYGLLFICITFVGIIAFEASIATRMHPIQYGLVGLAMAVFYLVLLSLAEHVGFGLAYAAASALSILIISCYVAASLRNVPRAGGMACLLAALYVLLFALLQMEDYALLVGTGLVLTMLVVLMYVTRNLSVATASDKNTMIS